MIHQVFDCDCPACTALRNGAIPVMITGHINYQIEIVKTPDGCSVATNFFGVKKDDEKKQRQNILAAAELLKNFISNNNIDHPDLIFVSSGLDYIIGAASNEIAKENENNS